MKKIIYLSSAITFMLASCSQENELAENIYDDKVEIELSASNDVEIQATRSDINSTSTKSFATNNIGIFCLADKVYKGDSKTKIQWTTDDKLARYIYNAKASATDLGGTTQISFDKKQYYPEEKKYGYSFYAYYPYKSNYSISSNATQCVVSYVIDGTQDIIWGYAQSKASGAYNADYARLHPSDKPKFAFNHSLAKIQFHIIGDKKSSQSDIQRLRLTELKIEVPQTVKLMAANTDVNKIGQLDIDYNKRGHIYVKDSDTKSLTPVQIDSLTSQKVGQPIMVPPYEKTNNTYRVDMKYVDSANEEHQDYFYIPSNTKLVAGKTYNITIKAKGPSLRKSVRNPEAVEIQEQEK